MPRPKKTTKSTYYKKPAYGKRAAAVKYKKRKRYKRRPSGFNNTQTSGMPNKKLFKFVKHFTPGANESGSTQATCFYALNENNTKSATSTTDQYGTVVGALTNWNYKNPSSAYSNAWNRMEAYYEKACLVGCKLTITFTNTDSNPIKIIAGICDWQTTQNITTPSYSQFQQIPGHRTIQLNSLGQPGSTKTLTFKVNPNKFTGHLKPMADTDTITKNTTPDDVKIKPYYDLLNMTQKFIAQDYLAFFYSQAIDLGDGTLSLPRNDKVLELSYVFTDHKLDGINAN